MAHAADKFRQMIQQNAGGEQRARLTLKHGYITSYDPKTYSVRVRLEPESTANETVGEDKPVVETGWIPLVRSYGGDGWGVFTPPKANAAPPYGDTCVVMFPDGGGGVALIGICTDVEKALRGATTFPSGDDVSDTGGDPKWGEYWLVHPKGGFLKLLNDGSVILNDKNGSQLFFDGAGAAILFTSGGTIEITAGGQITVQGSGGAKIVLTGSQVQIN